jgi:hypothetical protein
MKSMKFQYLLLIRARNARIARGQAARERRRSENEIDALALFNREVMKRQAEVNKTGLIAVGS